MVMRAELDRFAQEQGLPGQGLLDYFSRADELLIANLKLLSELTLALQGRPAAAPITIQAGGVGGVPLGVRVEAIMSDYKPRSTEDVYPERLANCQSAVRVVVFIRNSLDQDVGYSIRGNTSESPSGGKELATGTVTTLTAEIYQLLFEEWMPYVGAVITPAVAPSAGSIDVFVIVQE